MAHYNRPRHANFIQPDLEDQNCTLFLGVQLKINSPRPIHVVCQIHVSPYAFKQLHYDLDPFPEAYTNGLKINVKSHKTLGTLAYKI